MKRIATIVLITLSLALAEMAATPVPSALAQEATPEQWEAWNHWLYKHPDLRQHPEWLSNPAWERSHPLIMKWLREHPEILSEARGEGMWDREGRWRDSDWWHQNNPDEFWENHPEWAEHHQNWRGANDGDWDDHHEWRARNWWITHHRDWVENHHPNWLKNYRSNEPLQTPGQSRHDDDQYGRD
jgi:hypothetical protein